MVAQKMVSELKKKKSYINKNNMNNSDLYKNPTNFMNKIILLLNIIIFFQMIITISSNKNQIRQFSSHSSYINLTIVQRGYQTFLGSNFQFCPDEVYINNKKYTEEICKEANLNTKKNNLIQLVFFDNINNTDNMFNDLTNITIIDLSQFDSSLVTSMNNMFSNCKDLKTLIL